MKIGSPQVQQQQLQRAQQDIASKLEQLRPNALGQVAPEAQRSLQDAGEAHQKLLAAFYQQNDPLQQANLSRKEYALFDGAKANPELTEQLHTHRAAIQQLLLSEQAGVTFDQLKNLITTQAAVAIQQGGWQGYPQAEQLAQSLASLEAAQRLLSSYDQAVKTTPSYQRPKDATPVQPKWKEKLSNLGDSIKSAFTSTQSTASTTASTVQQPPPPPAAETVKPRTAPGSSAFEHGKFYPVPKTESLTGTHGLARTEAIDAERTLSALKNTGSQRVTVFVRDDGAGDHAMLGKAMKQVAELGRGLDVKRLRHGTTEAKNYLQSQGLHLGPRAEEAQLAGADAKGGPWIKAVFDLNKGELALSRFAAPGAEQKTEPAAEQKPPVTSRPAQKRQHVAPIAARQVALSYDGLVGSGAVKEPLFQQAEHAVKEMFDSGAGPKRATIYLYGRDVSEKQLAAEVLDQLAGLEREIGLKGAHSDRDRAAELRKNGLFFGEGSFDRDARTVAGTRPKDGVIKAVVDVNSWPPVITYERTNL